MRPWCAHRASAIAINSFRFKPKGRKCIHDAPIVRLLSAHSAATIFRLKPKRREWIHDAPIVRLLRARPFSFQTDAPIPLLATVPTAAILGPFNRPFSFQIGGITMRQLCAPLSGHYNYNHFPFSFQTEAPMVRPINRFRFKPEGRKCIR